MRGSFRFQTFILILVISVLPLISIAETIRFNYRESIIQQKISELRFSCNILVNQLTGSSVSASMTDDLTKEMNWVAEYCGGRLLLVDSSYRIVYDSYGIYVGKYCVSEEVIETFLGESYSAYISKNDYVEFTMPLSTGSSLVSSDDSINGVLIVSGSASWAREAINKLNRQIRLLEAAAVMILTVLAYVAASILAEPWNQVLITLRQILEGDLNVTFRAEGGNNETRQIIETFNNILERLRTQEAGRQEFVSNVSHELKTPITSMRVLADSLIAEENVPVDIYREFMMDISEEIDRETKIINDLLSLARLDRSNSELNITQVNINNLMEQILKRVRPIAKQRNIEITYESYRTVTADIDETKLSLALTNLIENGVKYNNDGGWVCVSVNADHKYFYIRVADSGVGIPVDVRDKIFDRFYRVDKARSRETGGTGLGLAITKRVIVMHHGAIRVDALQKKDLAQLRGDIITEKGSVFTVRIPLKYIA